MNDHGFVDASVCNNLGKSFSNFRALDRAAEYLSQAIELDPGCQAAYHNRALVHAQYAEDDVGHRASHGKAALADIRNAIELGSPKVDLYCDAALLHAQFAEEPGKAAAIAGYLRRAIEGGYDPDAIRKLEALKPYVADGIRRTPQTRRIDHDLATLLAPPTFFPPLTGSR